MTLAISIPFPSCQYKRIAPPRLVALTSHENGVNRIRMDDTAMNTTEDDIPALLDAVSLRRDVDAFEALFRYFAPRVKAYMARQLRDAQAAEELMQETMMAVWNKASQFDPARGNVSAWVFTIARNLRIDAYRKDRRPQFDASDPAFVPDDAPAADIGLEERQDAERLHRAMAGLPQEQFDLLKRSFFDDASHSAIAQQLNIPIGTVKSRIRLAFAKLRSALGEEA